MFQFPDLHIIPRVIAHRGANRFAPENTLSAFLKAKQLGFNWVEFDVMLSADHELVVIHDEELMRTTNGNGQVIDYPYSFLKELDAGSWFHSQFAAERISSLQIVLDFLYEHNLSANIEIKALQNCNELVVIKVLDILQRNSGRFISQPLISSFSHEVLQIIRKNAPNYLLGFLMHEWISNWEMICDELQCVTVNVNHRILNQKRIQAIKITNRQVLAYTVNHTKRAEQLFAWGVDAIFSDCPKEIIEMLHVGL
ncbi:MAG: glycerophosphodiester phosphodiesterase [Gammaproteobacteria bacterium]|nr:glycerophosphodiester phosphodiesterase [Gammaproteobacteria bacterium]